jgi:TatD DNase family protein
MLNSAKEDGVSKFINIGTSIKESENAIEVAEKYESVYATVAIYPHEHRKGNIDELINQLEKQATSSKRVVAIGECGIDVSEWKNQRPPGEQVRLFEAQIKLSQKLNLPLVIHNRNSDDNILDVLAGYKSVRGVVHCFDSSWEVAQKFLDLGLYISFSGLITYESKGYLLETVKNIPRDKYLIETDAPCLLPEPVRTESRVLGAKRHNEPKYVKMVGQKVAETRQINLEEAALQTSNNTCRLFGLKS